MGITKLEMESIAISLLHPAKKQLLMKPAVASPVASTSYSLPEAMKRKFHFVRVFTPQVKKLVADAVRHCKSDAEISSVVSAIKNVNKGLAGMSLRNVKCWLKREDIKQKLRRGRKVNYDFELEVWNELVEFGVQEKLEGGKMSETVVTVRTIAYSYAIVQERARKVQQMDKWKNDVNVQRLTFSLKWVHDFFRRMKALFTKRSDKSDS
jgi:hypothetical protein